jgi:hypothetical protein
MAKYIALIEENMKKSLPQTVEARALIMTPFVAIQPFFSRTTPIHNISGIPKTS